MAASRTVHFTPRNHWVEGWASPRAVLGAMAKKKSLCSCHKLNLGRPARKPAQDFWG
jgi:hypothetical protein